MVQSGGEPSRRGSWASSDAIRKTMVANRRADTNPERRLRSALHAAGLRFRKDHPVRVDDLRVRADVVFPRQRVCVFLDGCFWHRCPEHATDPKRNADYWAPKLAANVARDRRVDETLTSSGWLVIRIWEHEDPTLASARVRAAVGERRGR